MTSVGTDHKIWIAFVSATGGLGGPSRSLATLLHHLDGKAGRVLLAPNGSFVDLVRNKQSLEEHIRLVRSPRGLLRSRLSRLLAAVRIASWSIRNRDRITAIHANGHAELSLVALGALTAGIPVVVWAHASELSSLGKKLGRWWRRLLPSIRWTAVSPEAHRALVDAGLVNSGTSVVIVPNPIDPSDVVATTQNERVRTTIGFLQGRGHTTGYHMLPDVVEALQELPVRWLVFANAPPRGSPSHQTDVWVRLSDFGTARVELRGKVANVADAYAECDIVFCPSLRESFGRVAAEAMLNEIPVVASDIAPLRRLVGNEEAGLLFPVGDVDCAAARLRLLVEDPGLRRELGRRGKERARVFDPQLVVDAMLEIYTGPQVG